MDRSESDTATTGAAVVGDVLAHRGVKGMKWGVRKDPGHAGESAKTGQIAKLDKKFEKNATSTKTFYKTYNRAAKLSNEHDVARINNKPQYKGQDFRRDSPLRQKYYAEHQKAFMDNLEKAAGEFGTNASGNRKYSITEDTNGNWNVVAVDVTHDTSANSFQVQISYDSTGHIMDVSTPESTMTQGAESVSNVLAHHGVKGMKWGSRKSSSSAPSTSHASADHAAAEAHKATVRASGVKALSNADLKSLNERMQLESTHRNLSGQQPTKFEKGHGHVKKILSTAKTLSDIYNTANSPAGKALKKAVTK